MTAAVVALRCDAGPQVGAGHLVRSLALAEGLRRAGAHPVLVTGPVADVWRAMVAERKIAHVEDDALDSDTVGVDTLRRAASDAAIVVIDGYGFGPGDVSALRAVAPFVVEISDLGPERGADAVIDDELTADASVYPKTPLRLLGPDYALLREEFRDPPLDPVTQRTSVLVSLGGSATAALRPRLLEIAGALDRRADVRIVAGPHAQDAAASLQCGKATITILPPRTTLLAELSQARVALLAAGGVRYEAARCGCAMMLGTLADNQVPDAQAFADEGLAIGLGPWDAVVPTEVAQRLAHLLEDDDACRSLALRAARIVDGRGAERAAVAVLRAAGGTQT